MRIFAFEGPVHRTLEKIFDLMLLHFMWVLFSLPVITIGASTTALFTVTLKMAKKEEGYVLKGFLKAFRENFKKSTGIWLCFAAMLGWCVFMISISMQSGSGFLKLLSLAEAALLLVVIAALQYVFLLQARYENTLFGTVKNAFYISLKFLPYTAGMLAVLFVPILVTGYSGGMYAGLLFLWVFFGSSLIALGNSYIAVKVFDRIEGGHSDR